MQFEKLSDLQKRLLRKASRAPFTFKEACETLFRTLPANERHIETTTSRRYGRRGGWNLAPSERPAYLPPRTPTPSEKRDAKIKASVSRSLRRLTDRGLLKRRSKPDELHIRRIYIHFWVLMPVGKKAVNKLRAVC
jgi:hypothetical protein